MDFTAHNSAFARAFGETIAYTSPPNDPRYPLGIVEKPTREEEGVVRHAINIWFPVAPVEASGNPVAGFDPVNGDVLTYGGYDYVIVMVHPDGMGGVWVKGKR